MIYISDSSRRKPFLAVHTMRLESYLYDLNRYFADQVGLRPSMLKSFGIWPNISNKGKFKFS